MVSNLEDFVIPSPYVRTTDDDNAIAAASPDVPVGDDWNKPILNDFKENVRDYLRPLQNSRCAYCRCKIHENNASAEIEHIVPKNKRPDFMYDPRNYCLSCKICNTKKGHTKPILVNDKVPALPTDSASYLLINPYTDRYSDEIDIIDGILYKGIGQKGRYTIWLCGLDRIQCAIDRADALLESNKMTYVDFMVWLVKYDHTTLLSDWEGFLKRIKGLDVIKQYKQNNGWTID